MIAKLTNNGQMIRCPQKGVDGSGKYHTNLILYYTHNLDIATQDGYYPVVYTDIPGKNYESSWMLIGEQIIQIWTPYNENEN